MYSLSFLFLASSEKTSLAWLSVISFRTSSSEVTNLLFELIKYADEYILKAKQKHLPTYDDLNIKFRFIDNKLIQKILIDEKMMRELNDAKKIWLNNDHDVIRKIFIKLYNSELYKIYVKNAKHNFNVDEIFLTNVFVEFAINNKL